MEKYEGKTVTVEYDVCNLYLLPCKLALLLRAYNSLLGSTGGLPFKSDGYDHPTFKRLKFMWHNLRVFESKMTTAKVIVMLLEY